MTIVALHMHGQHIAVYTYKSYVSIISIPHKFLSHAQKLHIFYSFVIASQQPEDCTWENISCQNRIPTITEQEKCQRHICIRTSFAFCWFLSMA